MINVSTLAMHLQMSSSIRTLQQSLLGAQKEVSTGRKSDLMAALPDGGTRDVDMRNALEEATEYKATTDLVGSRLDSMQRILTGVKDVALDVRNKVLTARDPVSRQYLQDLAKTAIQQINSLLNTNVGGRALFSGIATDQRPLQLNDVVNTTTGVSPDQAIQQVIANLGPIADAASALAVANGADGIDAVFDDSNSNAALRFGTTFYGGATGGTVTARLDRGYDMDYGIRADDPAIKETLKGLYMIAGLSSQAVPPDAFAAWQGDALAHLTAGVDGVTSLSADLGFKQAQVAEAATRHEAMMSQLNLQIVNVERVDPYEAATRLTELQFQLEATFSTTTRLMRLSLTQYL